MIFFLVERARRAPTAGYRLSMQPVSTPFVCLAGRHGGENKATVFCLIVSAGRDGAQTEIGSGYDFFMPG
ncbi:hypothetical protein ACLRDC_06420 [Gluconacetobacter sacchari]